MRGQREIAWAVSTIRRKSFCQSVKGGIGLRMRYEKEGPNTIIVTSSTPVQQFLTTEQLHVEDPMPKEGHEPVGQDAFGGQHGAACTVVGT